MSWRQQLIVEYELANDCRLLVISGGIAASSVMPLEQLLLLAGSTADLHLMLNTLGGDGEAAIRMVRQVQLRCERLTVLVPNRAKSAGTLLTLGAHRIIMGPTSDLGPIDPQIWIDAVQDRRAAKTVVAAFLHAEQSAVTARAVAEFHASSLANGTATDAQMARDALAHSAAQLRQSLASNPSRDEAEVERLAQQLRGVLIDRPRAHSAVISASDIQSLGLPVEQLSESSDQWRRIWQLWLHYLAVPETRIYESADASYLFD